MGGVASLVLARSDKDSTMRNMRGVHVLSEPTLAVLGIGCMIGAHQLAAPVFHWPGVRGPMGALLAMALAAAVGSVYLDVVHHKSDMDDES